MNICVACGTVGADAADVVDAARGGPPLVSGHFVLNYVHPNNSDAELPFCTACALDSNEVATDLLAWVLGESPTEYLVARILELVTS